MFEKSIQLIEMQEHDSISVCLDCENEDVLALGERINKKFSDVYMNGYNWAVLIYCYLENTEPALLEGVDADPEAGMLTAYTEYSPENLKKMKKIESHIRTLLSDEASLFKFISDNYDEIEWD